MSWEICSSLTRHCGAPRPPGRPAGHGSPCAGPRAAPRQPLLQGDCLPPAWRGETLSLGELQAFLHCSEQWECARARRVGREGDLMERWMLPGSEGEGSRWELRLLLHFFIQNKEQLLFSSPQTPVCSIWLLLVFLVAALSLAVNGRLMQPESFCLPSFKESVYYEFISLGELYLGTDKEVCNNGTNLKQRLNLD